MKQALFRRVFGKSLFQGLDVENVVVLGTDQNLWLEHAPFGNLPPTRQQIDGNVEAFDAVDANTIYGLGSNGALWLEHGPFGAVPPPRQQVDGNVAAFDPVDRNNIYVLGSDGKFWLEFGPFGRVPPNRQIVDALGLPSSLTWNGGVGFGSGPTNANSNFKLTLSSNGNIQYSGVYNDTGSLPTIDAPTQDLGGRGCGVRRCPNVGIQRLWFYPDGKLIHLEYP